MISPLISLMQDQVEALRTANIPAAYINSTLTAQEVDETMQLARAGYLKLLYIAPERLESTTFLQALSYLSVPLLAVDEAHCISQWGMILDQAIVRSTSFYAMATKAHCFSADSHGNANGL